MLKPSSDGAETLNRTAGRPMLDAVTHVETMNLKLVPDVNGTAKVAQLVGYNLEDVHVHGAWEGEARLHLIPHVNCRVADLPVRRVVGGRHQVVDFVLPFGRVLHDYLA